MGLAKKVDALRRVGEKGVVVGENAVADQIRRVVDDRVRASRDLDKVNFEGRAIPQLLLVDVCGPVGQHLSTPNGQPAPIRPVVGDTAVPVQDRRLLCTGPECSVVVNDDAGGIGRERA